MHQYYVYILSNRRRTVLYIGVTNNLESRFFQHKTKLNKGFTNEYNCDMLVYYEEYSHIRVAIAREKRLKKYPRRWKENLINEFNPEWLDLSNSWAGYPLFPEQVGE
ncbi:MAG: GIY-YIG nuclease family protein [Bacteroidota bacterium]